MMKVTFDWDEINMLIALLQRQGISYLMGSDAPLVVEDVEPVPLIQRLAACNYPLVENACISLFILHPDYAPSVVKALQTSEPEIAENIAVLTLATLYLQQWWLFRLTVVLDHLPSFPDAPFVSLWEERRLPSPSSGYGMEGLLTLQEYQQQRYDAPLNFLDDWQNQIDHLLAQEEAQQRVLTNDMKEALKQLRKFL